MPNPRRKSPAAQSLPVMLLLNDFTVYGTARGVLEARATLSCFETGDDDAQSSAIRQFTYQRYYCMMIKNMQITVFRKLHSSTLD
ncbi:hypothetical protein T06_7578 [Trichinella sp. T6]|nr:hypothetical protein T06_7578 [Trichinella sp. T6]